MKPTLIIDCHAICHAVKHTMGDLSYEEKQVGIIFGFLKQLLALSKRFETNRFIFCWDSKKSKRREIYPNYKNRNHDFTPEEYQLEKIAFQQFAELKRKVVPTFGFKNNFIQTGYEADDIIAAITHNYNFDFVIISGDNDLYQLLLPTVKMYSPKSKKLFTEQKFIEEYSIQPKDWIEVKKIAGCKSDTVEGITNVGEKRAISYLKNEMKSSSKFYQAIQEGQDTIKRNEALVKLPFKNTKVPKLKYKEKFKIGYFMQIIQQYGFKSFQNQDAFDSWVFNFDMI